MIAISMKAIGERLAEERKKLGLNVDELSAKAGLHRNSVNNYEAGKSPINVAMLLIYSELGMDIGYVVTGRRDDGELGFAETQLLDAFGALSQRERGSVLQLILSLAGRILSADELAKAFQPHPTGKGAGD